MSASGTKIHYCAITSLSKSSTVVEAGNINKSQKKIVDAHIIKKVVGQDDKMKAFNANGSKYTHQVIAGYVFLCIADEKHDNILCVDLIKEMSPGFDPKRPPSSKTLVSLLEKFSGVGNSKIGQIQQDLDETRDQLHVNITSLMKRGEDLENLEETVVQMEVEADNMKTDAGVLKKALWYESLRVRAMIVCAVLILIIVALLIGCGITFERCGAPRPPTPGPPPPPAPVSPPFAPTPTPVPAPSPSPVPAPSPTP